MDPDPRRRRLLALVLSGLVVAASLAPVALRAQSPCAPTDEGLNDAGEMDECLPAGRPSGELLTFTKRVVQFAPGDTTLAGWLWTPEGEGHFPALLYNHGSEEFPGDKAEVGQFFTPRGFVFFVPHRRGQGQSKSAGPYIQDQLTQAARSDRNRLQVQVLEAQVEDQLAAFEYLKSLSYVDPQRIIVGGLSYGGIQTLLGAERDPGYAAALPCSPGSQSWAGNPLLQSRLMAAAAAIRIPTFLFQAANDYNLAPTQILGPKLQATGMASAVRQYPSTGGTAQDGHEFCVKGAEVWGPDALAFLTEIAF